MTTTARFYTKGPRGVPITQIVVHCTQSQEKKGILHNIWAWMRGKNAPHASAHVFVDDTTSLRSVDDKDIAWHCGVWEINRRSLGIELTGSASQTRAQWLDAFSSGVFDVAAKQIATWCRLYKIPATRLSALPIRIGSRGIFGHADVTNAYNVAGGHTDPGINFPWAELLRRVNKHLTPEPISLA